MERNRKESVNAVKGNGTGTELVPLSDFGKGTEILSSFQQRIGKERLSENFGKGPITDIVYVLQLVYYKLNVRTLWGDLLLLLLPVGLRFNLGTKST